jgi:hypothetical protein
LSERERNTEETEKGTEETEKELGKEIWIGIPTLIQFLLCSL